VSLFRGAIRKAGLEVMLLLALTSLGAAQEQLACIRDMTLPSFRGMIMTYIPTTVEVSVEIGENGAARAVRYDTLNVLLRNELDYFFKTKTTYSTDCRGRIIVFVVRYLVEGTPSVTSWGV
jgi:hypothetical protein